MIKSNNIFSYHHNFTKTIFNFDHEHWTVYEWGLFFLYYMHTYYGDWRLKNCSNKFGFIYYIHFLSLDFLLFNQRIFVMCQSNRLVYNHTELYKFVLYNLIFLSEIYLYYCVFKLKIEDIQCMRIYVRCVTAIYVNWELKHQYFTGNCPKKKISLYTNWRLFCIQCWFHIFQDILLWVIAMFFLNLLIYVNCVQNRDIFKVINNHIKSLTKNNLHYFKKNG